MPAKTAKITNAEYETLAGLRYSLRQFLRFSEEVARAAGITPQQHQALLAIRGFPGRNCVSVGELAERLQIRHHSAVGLVDRLVSKGFIKRKSAPTDRRQVYLTLTPRSEDVLEELSATHKEQLRRIGPQIESFLKRLRG
jgi:DNA-binding MarR family transcriptional regulator